VASTEFVNGVTLTDAGWFNDLDAFYYDTSYTRTRAAGTLAAGASNMFTENVTFTGHSGGTTDVRAQVPTLTIQGSNAVATAVRERGRTVHAGSATVTTAIGLYQTIDLSSTGGVTAARGIVMAFELTAAGAVTTGDHFIAIAGTFSSTGAVTTLNGFRCANIGHATLVTNAIGFKCDDITASATATRGIQLSLSAGTGKHNIYADGTAVNYIEGATGIGIAASATAALTLVGSVAGKASLRVPHGTAPTAPVDGDIWTTTAGLYVRINGGTVGPLS
jgi:hypothetical protein